MVVVHGSMLMHLTFFFSMKRINEVSNVEFKKKKGK